MTIEDRWLGVDELADYLGVSRDTIYTWLSKNSLPGHRVGKLWKFKREEVDRWVTDGAAAGEDDANGRRRSEAKASRS